MRAIVEKKLSNKQKPCLAYAKHQGRDRFSYDDLHSYLVIDYRPRVRPHSWMSRIGTRAEVRFLVSGFQDASVLHHYNEAAGETECSQEVFHSGGKYFRAAHFLPELRELFFRIFF